MKKENYINEIHNRNNYLTKDGTEVVNINEHFHDKCGISKKN